MGATGTVATADGAIPVYVATPGGTGPWPGVVVIHDALGWTDNTRRHADWLASAGFVASAPNLYTRGGKIACARAVFKAIAERKGPTFDDVEAARAALVARPDCSGKVGIIGFCMGGGFALVAAVGRGFAASSVNYGQVPKDAAAFLSGACPIVGSFGAKDKGFKGSAAALEAALSTNGVAHDVVEYPDASHAFLDQYHGLGGWLITQIGFGYRAVEAADARARITAFFAAHLA